MTHEFDRPALLNCGSISSLVRDLRGNRAYHNIQSPKLFDSFINSSFHIGFLANIGFNRGGCDIGKSLGNRCSALLGRLEIDINKKDIRSFLCKENGRFQSNAA